MPLRSPLKLLGAPLQWVRALPGALKSRPALAAIVGVVIVAAVAIPLALSGGASSQNNGTPLIFDKVQARTLQSTVQLTGTLARKNVRNVTAAGQGLVTEVESTNGATTMSGQVMFALNGRNAVA
ncbi:MAG TPA: hypothetical protein VKR22_14295, partial [Acidimicrobiales bacterium]|nr:hypothetical protein [Acidimicrobiales bacterium]